MLNSSSASGQTAHKQRARPLVCDLAELNIDRRPPLSPTTRPTQSRSRYTTSILSLKMAERLQRNRLTPVSVYLNVFTKCKTVFDVV